MAVKHTIRADGKGNVKVIKNLTRAKAIYAFCSECMGFNKYEVEKCTALFCPLYPYRNRGTTKGIKDVAKISTEIASREHYNAENQIKAINE